MSIIVQSLSEMHRCTCFAQKLLHVAGIYNIYKETITCLMCGNNQSNQCPINGNQ